MVAKGWREVPIGGLITSPGNSLEYATGDWRSFRPVWNESLCTNCKVCWAYCPDGAIRLENGEVSGINLTYCKGCGICASECPQKAISMIEEAEARETA